MSKKFKNKHQQLISVSLMTKKPHKRKRDLILCAFILALFVAIALFLIGTSVKIPLLDVTANFEPSGTFTLTFTGVSEIIIAFASAIGIFLRIKRR